MSVQSSVGYAATSFDVDVATEHVLVTAAMERYGAENNPILARLIGKIRREIPDESSVWCKAEGLYSHSRFEARISSSGATLDFGFVSAGTYLLSCVSDQRIVALQSLTLYADSKPFEIVLKPIQSLGALQR
jgi:hypothetical protein